MNINSLDTKASISSIKTKSSIIIHKIPQKFPSKQRQKKEETTRKNYLFEQMNKSNLDEENKQKQKASIINDNKYFSFKALSSYYENRQKEAEDNLHDEPYKYDRINNDNFYITTKGGITSYPHISISKSNQKKQTILKTNCK